MEKSPIKVRNGRLLAWSFAASSAINAFLLSSAFVGGPNTFYGKLADTIAVPPGIIADRFFAPKEHTASGFIDAGLLSIAFSVLFYGVIFWVLMRGAAWLGRLRRKAD